MFESQIEPPQDINEDELLEDEEEMLKDLLQESESTIKELINHYLELSPINKITTSFESYLNDLSKCLICEEIIYEHDEKLIDDSNTYGNGYCHEECFSEAQESRL